MSPKEKSELKNYVLDALKKGIALEVMSSRPSEDDRPKKGIRKGKGISETVKPKATGRGNVKGKGRQSSGATMTRSRSASVSLKPSESRNSSLDDGPSPSSSTDLPFKKPKLSPFSEPPTSEPSIFLDQDGSNLHELNHQIHENNRKRSKTFSLSLPPVRNSKTKPNTLESYRQGFADNAKNVIVEILRKNPGVGDIVPKKVGIKEAEKNWREKKRMQGLALKHSRMKLDLIMISTVSLELLIGQIVRLVLQCQLLLLILISLMDLFLWLILYLLLLIKEWDKQINMILKLRS